MIWLNNEVSHWNWNRCVDLRCCCPSQWLGASRILFPGLFLYVGAQEGPYRKLLFWILSNCCGILLWNLSVDFLLLPVAVPQNSLGLQYWSLYFIVSHLILQVLYAWVVYPCFQWAYLFIRATFFPLQCPIRFSLFCSVHTPIVINSASPCLAHKDIAATSAYAPTLNPATRSGPWLTFALHFIITYLSLTHWMLSLCQWFGNRNEGSSQVHNTAQV